MRIDEIALAFSQVIDEKKIITVLKDTDIYTSSLIWIVFHYNVCWK